MQVAIALIVALFTVNVPAVVPSGVATAV